MKPIIILAVMAIAITGLGVGSLGNVITLDVQSLGVGDADLVSPITNADIKFNIAKIQGNQGNFKNVISDCFITSGQQIDAMSHVFCKLTDENGNVVAEGVTWLSSTLNPGSILTIPIDDPNFLHSQVQNIHDVVLVVQGPPSGGGE